MPSRGPAVLAFALSLAAAPLLAQSTAKAGEIHGTGTRAATGEIHVVGTTMGAQQIHFTDAFKVEPSANLHAMLSGDLSAASAADLGAIASAGDQLIAVPKDVDVSAYALLLVYDTKYKTVVATAILPNAKGQAYGARQDSAATRSY
jgi:hypothetical protein